LLRRPLGGPPAPRIGQSAHQFLPTVALGRFRPHLIQAHAHAARRRRRVDRDNRPLFCANAGSTGLSPAESAPSAGSAWLARSPNQPSWVRQRRPSASNRSSIRLRLIGRPFSSLRYTSSRSNVQLANGNPSSVGLVKAAAITALTCSAVYVGGWPDRGA